MVESKVGRAALFTFTTLLFPAIFLSPANAGAEQSDSTAAVSRDCSNLQPTSYPKTAISNAVVKAVVYLPDATNGYYRGTRFDWSGVLGCLTYKGHTYFGQWFPKYNPLTHDAISGPVEEFHPQEGALGYDAAKPGDLFVKPGVGVLRKVGDAPYSFAVTYPLIDSGKWTVKIHKSGVSFTHHLHSSLGIAYVYTKNLRLDKNEPVLLLEHEMKNTGQKPIEMDVYDHDFYMIDNTATGPDMAVHFAFEPTPKRPLQFGGKIEGKDLTYEQELEPRQSVTSYLTGFSDKVSDYDITVENRKTGAGVEQTSDSPLSDFNFWSIRTTVCPEAYIHLNIPPGQTAHWTIKYRFNAK